MTVAPTVVEHHLGGETIDRHRHDEHQLVYVSTGVLAVETAAGSWVAAADRAVWLPAGTWHQHRFYGASAFHTLGFPADDPPLHDNAPTILAVTGLVRELMIACTEPTLGRDEERRLRAVLRDQLGRMPQEPISLRTPRHPQLRVACALAAERLEHPLPLAELARAAGVSDRTLSRLFRKELGMTYPQWRTNVRVLEAIILLAGGASVTEAGQRCGWMTTSSFIDAFRRTTNQTPGTYRTARSSRHQGGSFAE